MSIQVADTSFRLYVGIKQSGSFQHSSFLQGARIAAAGTLKIKDGQLRRLSPLSGHYRAPTSNFRRFVHAIRDEGVDMSRVSISRSYAVLVGLEAYTKTRKKIKKGAHHVEVKTEKIMHPEEARKREEAQRDKSKSAEKERQVLAAEAERNQALRREGSVHHRLMRKLRIDSNSISPDGQRKSLASASASVSASNNDEEDSESPHRRSTSSGGGGGGGMATTSSSISPVKPDGEDSTTTNRNLK